MTARFRVLGRRAAVLLVVGLQVFFVAHAGHTDHKPFAFRMFPESSTWRADVVRVTGDGRRVPVDQAWDGYRWENLVRTGALRTPWVRQHADAGLRNQLAFLDAALDWVADNTPRDRATRYLEARVTAWHNADPPRTEVLRSHVRGDAS